LVRSGKVDGMLKLEAGGGTSCLGLGVNCDMMDFVDSGDDIISGLTGLPINRQTGRISIIFLDNYLPQIVEYSEAVFQALYPLETRPFMVYFRRFQLCVKSALCLGKFGRTSDQWPG
jgi:hypothetical protein